MQPEYSRRHFSTLQKAALGPKFYVGGEPDALRIEEKIGNDTIRITQWRGAALDWKFLAVERIFSFSTTRQDAKLLHCRQYPVLDMIELMAREHGEEVKHFWLRIVDKASL